MLQDGIRFTDAVSETGIVQKFATMEQLLPWQHKRTCLILLVDFLYL